MGNSSSRRSRSGSVYANVPTITKFNVKGIYRNDNFATQKSMLEKAKANKLSVKRLISSMDKMYIVASKSSSSSGGRSGVWAQGVGYGGDWQDSNGLEGRREHKEREQEKFNVLAVLADYLTSEIKSNSKSEKRNLVSCLLSSQLLIEIKGYLMNDSMIDISNNVNFYWYLWILLMTMCEDDVLREVIFSSKIHRSMLHLVSQAQQYLENMELFSASFSKLSSSDSCQDQLIQRVSSSRREILKNKKHYFSSENVEKKKKKKEKKEAKVGGDPHLEDGKDDRESLQGSSSDVIVIEEQSDDNGEKEKKIKNVSDDHQNEKEGNDKKKEENEKSEKKKEKKEKREENEKIENEDKNVEIIVKSEKKEIVDEKSQSFKKKAASSSAVLSKKSPSSSSSSSSSSNITITKKEKKKKNQNSNSNNNNNNKKKKNTNNKNEGEAKNVSKLSIENYVSELVGETFGTASIYKDSIFTGYDSSLNANKMNRIMAELSTLSSSLQSCVSKETSIFLRVDEENMNYFRFMIIGPKDTPYQDGCFEFDMYLPENYPSVPPKCQLRTTNNNTFRFNPNLYENGYVCLSLLGTWGGAPEEQWDPSTSTLYQVLLSIQSLIFVSEPYYNEPGYQYSQNSNESEYYNQNITRGAINYAIIDQARNKSSVFYPVISKHLLMKADEIREHYKSKVAQNLLTDFDSVISSL